MFREVEPQGDVALTVVESGPDKDRGEFHPLLVAAIHRAESSVVLVTPYFIPDTALMTALDATLMRGLDVVLLVPRRSDHRLIDLAMPNYVYPLVRAGARVYERSGPLLHMKLAIIDGSLTIAGSSNLDNRSLFLNFELDLAVPGAPFARRIRDLVDAEVALSQRVGALRGTQAGFARRLVTRLAGLFSPVL
jgi:cardiolipin synthase